MFTKINEQQQNIVVFLWIMYSCLATIRLAHPRFIVGAKLDRAKELSALLRLAPVVCHETTNITAVFKGHTALLL